MIFWFNRIQDVLDTFKSIDFLGPVALRLYLFFPFWMAGLNKLADVNCIALWFGNLDWGLGLPFPLLMAWLATLAEVIGAACLLLGLAVRWVSIPLIITMLVAIFSVHWDNGWFAIAQSAAPELSGLSIETIKNDEVAMRLNKAKEILKENSKVYMDLSNFD